MIKRLLAVVSVLFAQFSSSFAQCPQIMDPASGNFVNNPVFLYCVPGDYTMSLLSNTAWGPYTINWGDGTSTNSGASNPANTPIQHIYDDTVGVYTITLSIPGASCTRTMLVVMEQAVAAGAQNFGGVTKFCAPGTVTVTNLSTNVSPTTVFTWNWGDGTPPQTFDHTNYLQNLTHTFAAGTVLNCQRMITLEASNYCRPIPNPLNLFVDIYDVDPTSAAGDKAIKCFPENTFTLTNTTVRQCFAQGNTFQRQEKWNLGDYWGLGHDSIIDWKPWPPVTPRVVTYPGLGTYSFTLLDSNMCGVRAVTQTVSIVPPPTASLVVPTGNICQNTTVTFTNASATGFSYKWNFGTGAGFTNLGGGNKSIIYATPGTYTVKLVVFITGGGNSCSDTASAVINVLAAPVSNFTYAPTTGCSSIAAVTFTDTSTGAVSWNWDFGNGNTFNGQVPPSQSYTNTGVFVAALLVTGSTTCVHTKTANIVVRSTPVPAFPTFTNCLGVPSAFTNSSTITGTTAISNYTWNFGDGSPITTTQTPTHTYTMAGTYSVQLIAATPYCSATITQTIAINVKPTANFAFTPTVNCPPFVSSFTNTSLNGTSYLWRFGTASTATSGALSPSFTYTNNTQSIQNYTVTLVTGTGAGCSDSLKKVISVYPEPVASYSTPSNAGCSPITFSFVNTTINGNTYDWDFGDGAVSTQTNPLHTFTNTTLSFITRTLQLVATNIYGCKDTTQQTYQIFPEPFISFSMTPGAGCSPLIVNFSSVPGIISYTWDYGDGSPLSNANTNIVHTYYNNQPVNKTHTVTLMATNAFGCVDTTYGYPLIYAKPTASYNLMPNAGCAPLVVSFTNASNGNASNQWTFGNGKTSTLLDPTATYTSLPGDDASSYTVKLVITSSDNCKDSTTRQVQLFDHPKSVFNSDTAVCSPSTVSFNNTSIHANAYSWSLGDGNVSFDVNTQNFYQNTTAFDVKYKITLVSTSNDGCKDTLSKFLNVHPKPVFFISSQPDSGCTPLNVHFENIVGVTNYKWTFTDGNEATEGDIYHLFVNGTGSDKIFKAQLIATDKYGCLDTAVKSIKVFPYPVANFGVTPDDPPTVFIPNQAIHTHNFSTKAVKYLWRFGDGETSAEKEPEHFYTQKGQYQISLLVTSEHGCLDSFALPAKIIAMDETAVQMPNAFTPNPNGPPGSNYDPKATDNDVFHPQIRGAEKYLFSIYSRWGELLFETKNPNEGWDGYYKGKMCTQDVYIWKIAATFIDGKTFSKTGDVLLLK